MNALAEFDAQPRLEPGTEGWWQVWGANPTHIRRGDILLLQGEDPIFVEDTFTPKSAPMRVGIVVNGEQQTLGALYGPLVLVRRGTHNTLA